MAAEPQASGRPKRARVLVVDDEESMRHFLSRGLSRLGYEVPALDDGDAAIAAWEEQPCDLAVVDLKMPGTDGMQVLRGIRALDPQAAVVLMSAYGTIARAVEAMHLGATDFIAKPFEIDELVMRIERALDHRRTREENHRLRGMLDAQAGRGGMVGQSSAMLAVQRTLDLLRGSSATVLVTGESGVGKGLLARTLHRTSDRAEGPFVSLYCAALPDALLENELFGHEAGAFTGARTRKRGLIAKSDGGTLFLDEIGEMSLAAQAKIERFLQDRELVPLGGSEPIPVDVRVIAASNRDLAAAVRDGSFRADLLWRLDVVQIHVPPLRDRREDIPLLATTHLHRLATGGGSPPKVLDPAAMRALLDYAWPGNVRELENVLERMVVLSGQRPVLVPSDLPPCICGLPADGEGSTYDGARAQFDRDYFSRLLLRTRGNVTEAARAAGLSRGHLHRRLRSLGIGP